jgi:hypothetical protein
VRVSGSPNERRALLFRDRMCAHPHAVIAYSAIKRSLAAVIPDLDTYAEVKDQIVDLVIVTAEEWAMETGWTTSTQPRGSAPIAARITSSSTHFAGRQVFYRNPL